MNSIKIVERMKSSLMALRKHEPFLERIVCDISKKGGRSFLVGGAVRDSILGEVPKDIDVEVYGVALNEFEAVLKKYGIVRFVGKQFGVFRIDGCSIDFSVARIDSAGRHPQVTMNPYLSIKEAALRRDLTMNAMLVDLLTSDLEDPFNGLQDIENKILRAPSLEFFVQDPLRFYRVLQFIGRFGMWPDEELSRVCTTMEIASVSKERIFQEYEKLFLFSKKPSLALDWLDEIGRLKELLPELHATKGVAQNLEYHPEGDVFEHTKQAIDGAASLEYQNDKKRLMLVFAALCHDLGKVATSRIIDGRIRSHGHDVAGVPLAQQLLRRITGKNFFERPVTRLVRYHMQPYYFLNENSSVSDGAYKRLARNLAPDTCIEELAQLAVIDKSARNSKKKEPLPFAKQQERLQPFIDRAKILGVWNKPEQPLLTGVDLQNEGIVAGPCIGVLLERAYDLQIEKGITDKELLKKMLKMYV